MATKVTSDDIIKMNEMYLQLHTYAAVARQVGFSASTVAKYIRKDYKPTSERVFKRFTDDMIPDLQEIKMFCGVDNYGSLCILSDDEKEEIKGLWEELDI